MIVGAGPAGLSAAAALTRRGVTPVLLEQDGHVGERWQHRYERLRLHTVRTFSGLAHHGMPRTYPRYVPKDLVAEYLRDYAQHFDLDVRTNTRVRTVTSVNGNWRIDTGAEQWEALAVVVATGHYNTPLLPSWPGIESYAGRVLHSTDYRSGCDFAGSRVLVVGLGNTGAELAADLVEQGAAAVEVAVRTPPPIVPRQMLGLIPVQLFGLAFARIPAPGLLDRFGALTRRVAVGDLRPYGLGQSGWGPFTARRPPVIDVGFLAQLKARRVVVRPTVTALHRAGAVFADGSEGVYDVIVASTGYDTGLRELLDDSPAIDELGMPSGNEQPGLYFIGYDETIGGHLRRANLESKRLAKDVARYLRREHGGRETSSA